MTLEIGKDNSVTQASHVKPLVLWPSIPLGIFVPAFGFLRAGKWRAFISLYIGFYLMCSLLTWIPTNSWIPAPLCIAFVLLIYVAWFLLLGFGVQKGKMSPAKWLVFLSLLIANCVFDFDSLINSRIFRVPTGGMAPTIVGHEQLLKSDHILVNKTAYYTNKPERGDIIAFETKYVEKLNELTKNAPDTYFTERIIGLPGERITIKKGRVFLNNTPLLESDGIPPLKYLTKQEATDIVVASKKNVARQPEADSQTFLLKNDEYLVLGDNSANSFDSRYYGPIPKESIYGQVEATVYPLSRSQRFD